MKLAVAGIEPWTFRTLTLGLGIVGLFAIVRIRGGSLRPPPG